MDPAEQKVTPLELFFDLVFVFAITQVTALMAGDPSWEGLARGMLVLAALWWAWAAYAWLTNNVNADEGGNRLVVFAAMAAMLVVALAVPHAFNEDGVLFASAYFVVRFLHIALYAQASRSVDLRRAIIGLAPTSLIGASLLLAAGFADGTLQGLLWVAALAIDYAGPLIRGPEGYTVSPGHFAERHGLIVIIAIGESIVAVGVGAAGLELDAAVVAAAALGIAVAAAIWWAYFDVVAPVAERKLHEATGSARVTMARDSYSYIHYFAIAGIVLMALGMKKTLEHVDEPLKLQAAVGLCGGVALFLLAMNAFRLRNVRTLNRQRLVASILLLALIPVATEVDALVALAAVAGVAWALIAYEAIRHREARARVRAAI